MTIKAWDWDKGWKNIQTYEGHTHYLMNLTFNPKDANTFVSACLDRTVKMWSIGSSNANFTSSRQGCQLRRFLPRRRQALPCHHWRRQDRQGLGLPQQELCADNGGSYQQCLVRRLPPQPSDHHQDGTVKIWNSGTYRIENTLNYALERAWCVSLRKDANEVAVGFDEGVVVIKVRNSLISRSKSNAHPAR